MKIKWLCVLGFLLLIINSFSQIRILNQSLIYPDSAVLYVGVDNWLKIEGTDSSKQYFVHSSYGNLKESSFRNFNTFYLYGNKYNYRDTIVVYNSKMQKLAEQIFRVDFISDPITVLDSIPVGFITKNQLMKAQRLYVEIPNCLLRSMYDILSFSVIFNCKKCDDFPVISNAGSFMSPQFFKVIPYLTFGDKVIFEEIKVKGSSAMTRKLPAIAYTIK
ncbi:MAG TPA: GldM family protein [Chitinophagales bacterium]|nr:GldM family protein [Chitinophagales bacterium]